MPDWMVRSFEDLDDDPERRQEVATEVGVRLCRALYEQGVDEFHFYTTNRSEIPIAICAALGVDGEAEASAASTSGL